MTLNIADTIHRVSSKFAASTGCIAFLLAEAADHSRSLYFLHDHPGHPIPLPKLFKPMHDRFVTRW